MLPIVIALAERLGFKPKIGFKNLSPVAQRAATYDFLAGLRMRDSEGRRMSTFNVKMIPPVSKEGVTLLDPDVMQKYFTEYNKQLDILDNIEDINNPEKFWQEVSEDIFWFKKPTRILNKSKPPFYKWFEDGITNTCYNALDVHIDNGRGDRIALILSLIHI